MLFDLRSALGRRFQGIDTQARQDTAKKKRHRDEDNVSVGRMIAFSLEFDRNCAFSFHLSIGLLRRCLQDAAQC